MGKIDINKLQKRISLLDSAFDLFIKNGFHKTSIADIVNNAGVAKGTFYLYFKDKNELRNHLIVHKVSQIFEKAYGRLQKANLGLDFEEEIIFVIDNVLDQLKNNRNLVLLLSKHFSWGFLRNSLYYYPGHDAPPIFVIFQDMLVASPYRYSDPELMMYMILGLVSGSSYQVILQGQPISLDELKPHLFTTVRSIFHQFRISS